MTEEEFSFESHFGLGMVIRNDCFRGGDGQLIEHLRQHGLEFPIHLDDISDIIIRAYYRHLIDVDIDLESLIAQNKESNMF